MRSTCSLFVPFLRLNTLTDFNEIWYKRLGISSEPNMVSLIFYTQEQHGGRLGLRSETD
jgi:hypothetical protein